jgi:hypothetical protein
MVLLCLLQLFTQAIVSSDGPLITAQPESIEHFPNWPGIRSAAGSWPVITVYRIQYAKSSTLVYL